MAQRSRPQGRLFCYPANNRPASPIKASQDRPARSRRPRRTPFEPSSNRWPTGAGRELPACGKYHLPFSMRRCTVCYMEINPLPPIERPRQNLAWPLKPPSWWARAPRPPAFVVLIAVGAFVGMVLAGIGFGAAVLVFYGMGGTWHDSYGPEAPHGPCRAGTMYLRTDPPGHPSFYICTEHPLAPQNPQTIHQ